MADGCDILVAEEFQSPEIDRLATLFAVERRGSIWKDRAALAQALASTRAVMIRNQTRLTRDLIASAKRLLAIGRVGVGLDNIDLDAANEHGVVIIAPLDANATSVAELTLGLILALARKIPHADRSTKSGGWDRLGCTGMEIDRKVLTLCGFGRVGRSVAARARAFGMNIVVFDPFVKTKSDDPGVTHVQSLKEALGQGDFVSAHLPLTAQTKHLFNAEAFAAMKPGAFFINTSRGGIVDEHALLAALGERRIAGAALDVRETEPPPAPNPFAAFENVILTPHIGAFTIEAQARTFQAVCGDLERVLRGESADNFINFPQPRK